MEEHFSVNALESALRRHQCPEIFHTDQGSQYTGKAFTGVLKEHKITISMHGKGRAMDNIMVERLWRIVLTRGSLVSPQRRFTGAPQKGCPKRSETTENLIYFLQKRCVDKLMHGPGHNLMDNSSSCLQVATQAAHELIHDGFIQLQQQDLYVLFFKKSVLTEGATKHF